MAGTDTPPRTPMTHLEAQRLVSRLALQGRATADIPHGKLKHLRLVGFIIEKDEHWTKGEGVRILEALQLLAGIDLKSVQRKLTTVIGGGCAQLDTLLAGAAE